MAGRIAITWFSEIPDYVRYFIMRVDIRYKSHHNGVIEVKSVTIESK